MKEKRTQIKSNRAGFGGCVLAMLLITNTSTQSASSAETLLKVHRLPADSPMAMAPEKPDLSAVLASEGFENHKLAIDVGRFTQNTEPKFVMAGKASLRVDCPKGDHNATCKLDYHPPLFTEKGKGEDQVHIRAYLYFPNDFQIAPCSELKLFGCFGWGPGLKNDPIRAGARVTGTDGFTCRVLIGRDDTLRFYTYHPLQRGGYGDHIGTGVKIERGRWYCIELGLRVNTVLKATPELLSQKPELKKWVRGDYVVLEDGLARCWVDGRLRAELADVRWRDIPDLQIRRCLAFPYFGGAGERNTSPKDQVFYVDELVISRSYAGPIDQRKEGKE